MKTIEAWKEMLRARLKAAMSARQSHIVTVLRETMAALDNAEAPPITAVATPEMQTGEASAFAGSAGGLGAGDIARLTLSPEAVLQLIEREIRERREAAVEYLRLGQDEQAGILNAQADLLDELKAEAS